MVGLDTTVCKTAPDSHADRCDDDRAYQRDTIQHWFTRALQVEDPNNQKY